MNELKVVSVEGQLVTDSRDVAELTGKDHKELLRSIRQYISILTSAKLRSLDFFIPSYYLDAKKEQRPCFYLTKMGCDMVANKMTGERGVLFTAAYVKQFDEMQKEISSPKPLSPTEQLVAAMQLSLENHREVSEIKTVIIELQDKVDNQITLDHGEQRRIQRLIGSKVYEVAENDSHKRNLFAELHREIKDRFGVASYKDLKRQELLKAINYIESWVPKKSSGINMRRRDCA